MRTGQSGRRPQHKAWIRADERISECQRLFEMGRYFFILTQISLYALEKLKEVQKIVKKESSLYLIFEQI